MSFSLSSVRFEIKNETLKRHLIDIVCAQTARFIRVAEEFYAKSHRTEDDYRQFCEEIIEAAEQVLGSGNWGESLFLHNTLKPIKKIYETALFLKKKLDGDTKKHFALELPENKIKLYVSLYQSNGYDYKQWIAQLASLGSYMVSRPIYKNESDVIKAIQLKLSQVSEAYVVVVVDPSRIIYDESRPRKDRMGNTLVTLTPAIKKENIIEFVHQGKRYYYREQTQELLLKSDEIVR